MEAGMSVRLMAEVFARYPRGGSEMLLALAIADHAHDDGTSVRPSVRYLAEKTRQSERAVQYQLRNMEAEGWLQLVANAGGGRNTPREYRINPDWVRGANSAPLEKGAAHGPKGCKPNHERVQTEAEKGATAIAPEPSVNHQEPPEEPTPRKRGRAADAAIDLPEWVPADLWAAWLEVRRKIRAPNTAQAQRLNLNRLEALRAAGQSPAAVLEQAISRGWRGLFPLKDHHDHDHRPGGGRLSAVERVKRANAEAGYHDA